MGKILELIDRFFPAQIAYAHCDIPCGIYVTHPAQTAAQTVARMVELIQKLPTDGLPEDILQARNNFVRLVMVKEQHAESCKKELLILWTDYFKEEHLEMFPDLHDKIWQATKLCSQNKREVSPEAAQKLQDAVHEIAHVFEAAEKAKKKT